MKKLIILPLFLICSFPAFAQWSGTTLDGSTYRNGNVGIGTSSPTSKLHVDSYNYNALTLLRSPSSSGGVSMDMLNSEGYRWSILVGHESKFYISRQGNGSGGTLTIDTDSKVGIGTKTPTQKLEVNGNIKVGSNNSTTTGYGNRLYFSGVAQHTDHLWIARFNVDDKASELRINLGDDYGDKLVVGNHYWNGGEWVPTLTVKSNGRVGIGTTNPDAPLTVAGNIHAREVKVTATAGGADFVFADDYALPSLEEVDAFVKANKHLPEIPSAAEMEKNGLHLAEMNIKLLQKVEELTLYLIEKEAQLKKMEQRLQALEEAIAGQQD